MSEQTKNQPPKTTDKEKTVKKRAARNIVAPRADEEMNQHEKHKEVYIPNSAAKPVKPKKEATIVVSPVNVPPAKAKKRPAMEVTAPLDFVWNDDKLPPLPPPQKAAPKRNPAANRTASAMPAAGNGGATGWPDRPPAPKVAGPANAVRQQTAPNPQMTHLAQSQMSQGQRQVTGQLPATTTTQTIQEVTGADGQPRKLVKTVVTTTTTTYEPLTEEDLIRITTQQTGPIVTAAPARQAVVQQPAAPVRKPGETIIQTPVLNKAAVRPQQTQPAPGVQPGQPQQPVQPQSGQPVIQTQPQQVTAAAQPAVQTQQVQQPVQQPQTMQPQAVQQQPVQQAQPQKPMTAMDKQFADIEKALGLTGDQTTAVPVQTTAAGVAAPVAGNALNPAAVNQPVDKALIPGTPVQPMDSETKKSMEYLMLGLEALIFVIILCICISIYQKIKNKDYAGGVQENGTATEESAGSGNEEDILGDTGTESFEVEQAGASDEILTDNNAAEGDILADASAETTAPSDSVDVDNDRFTLHCTNITVTLDSEGNPAALIFFSFTNKTSSQLSMSEVFPPSVTQNGEPCETFASLSEYPEEFYNKDMQVSDGSTINCCYAVSLKDAVSPIRLTIHDNYETFADIGTTEIAIQ